MLQLSSYAVNMKYSPEKTAFRIKSGNVRLLIVSSQLSSPHAKLMYQLLTSNLLCVFYLT